MSARESALCLESYARGARQLKWVRPSCASCDLHKVCGYGGTRLSALGAVIVPARRHMRTVSHVVRSLLTRIVAGLSDPHADAHELRASGRWPLELERSDL